MRKFWISILRYRPNGIFSESENTARIIHIAIDTLVVTHRDSTWSLPRNKVIDKFIRKSRWVYNKIDRNEDKYVLSFLLEEKVVYSISYDDIGYPEGAIEIMSDDILRNLLKSLYMQKNCWI